MTPARVLLADDHSLVVEGIRKLLGDKVTLVGVVTDGRQLVKSVEENEVDVVLLDISMPLLNGIDAARQIRKISPRTKIIFLTMHSDRDYVAEALRLGASGYLLKWSAETELLLAIETVLRGGLYLTPALPAETTDLLLSSSKQSARPKPVVLSVREREVLQLVVEGKSAKQIGEVLHVSAKTVEFHKYRMLKKLGLHNAVELARYAMEREMLSPVSDKPKPPFEL
jgi:DNA-binding NarL/FixJ family response regulator